MIFNRFAVPALALILGTTGLATARAYPAPYGSPAPAYAQQRGDWDAPPRELSDVQRRGFQDGMAGARKDFENHRRPDVDNRDEFRQPHLPPALWEEYRAGFRRGYQVAMSHLVGGPPPQVMEPEHPMREHEEHMGDRDRGGWEPVQARFNEIQRRGFQDGMEGARKDLENRRRPDPNNRDEYRDPPVQRELQDDYREGFRNGYERAVVQLTGEPEQGPWDMIPGRFSEIQRRGFQDGMEGARKDVENHRRPDPNNRDEYREPRVPRELQDEYREGFRRGYERAMAHLMGGPDAR